MCVHFFLRCVECVVSYSLNGFLEFSGIPTLQGVPTLENPDNFGSPDSLKSLKISGIPKFSRTRPTPTSGSRTPLEIMRMLRTSSASFISFASNSPINALINTMSTFT